MHFLSYLRLRSGEGNLGGEDGAFLPLDEGLLLRVGDGLLVSSFL